MDVTWSGLLLAFMLCHLVGDFLLQTDAQARRKHRGLGPDPAARRALLSHVATYALAFVPGLVWLGTEQGALLAVVVGVLVAVPHAIVDDGRLVAWYVRVVKRIPGPAGAHVTIGVDQSLHAVCLSAVALLAVV